MRNITFTTSDAFQKAAYSAAYKNSAGGGIEEKVSGISKTLSDIGDDVRAIAVKIGATIKNVSTAASVVGIGASNSAAAVLAKDRIGSIEAKGGKDTGYSGSGGFWGREPIKPQPVSAEGISRGGKEPAPKKDEGGELTYGEDGAEVTYGGLSLKQQQEMLDISKRRFHDGHPGGK